MSEQWFAERTCTQYVIDADGLYIMRGRLYVPDLPTHLGLRDDILHDTLLLEIHSPSGLREDISRCVPIFSVARADERCLRHGVSMSCLSTGQDRTPETRKIVAAIVAPE